MFERLPGRDSKALRAALLAIAVAAAYAPSFDAGFLHDDDELITANPVIQRGGRSFGAESWRGLGELWWPGAELSAHHLPGIPLTATSLWLEWRLWGSDEPDAAAEERGWGAPGYHVVNIALHALCALLLWHVLAALGLPGAWLAALLWAVHPVCVESVAWISERKNTLSMLFMLASTAAWIRWLEGGARRDWLRSLAAFALALLAKPAAVPLAVVLPGLAWWKRGRLDREVLRASLPGLGLALASGLFAISMQHSLATGGEQLDAGTLFERLHRASFALGFYLWKALVPLDLMVVYPRWHETLHWALQLVPGAAALLLALAAWRARERWGRHLLFALGGYVAMLAPALGLVPMSYLRLTLVADHFQYYALPFPLALGVGAWASAAWARRGMGRRVSGVAAAAAVALGVTLSAVHAARFEDRLTLFTHTAERNPDTWLAHNQLGALALGEGRLREAARRFERAVELAPGNFEVHSNLGATLEALGEGRRAVSLLRRAVELAPSRADLRRSLGHALLRAGQPDEALASYEAALEREPEDAATHLHRGMAQLHLGRVDEAIAAYERALRLDPDLPAGRALLEDARARRAGAEP